jgi:hypothetical protein
MILRGTCELSSRNVFFVARSVAVGGYARHEGMFARRGALPIIGHSFQEYFPRVSGLSVACCHGPSSTPTSTVFSGVPSFSATPSTLCEPAPRVTRNERLQLHGRNRRFRPFHLSVDHFPFQRAVPTCLEFTEILVFLRVDAGKPFDICHPIPTGYKEPKRESLMAREGCGIAPAESRCWKVQPTIGDHIDPL